MIKKQRGSAAVLALVMLLFLALAGGAWVLMHAQDNATAMSDAKEQQAWYAAEAGVKRAKAELENSNANWEWLNTDKDKDFKDDGKFLALDPDAKTTDAKTAKYAVSITYPTSSSDTTPIYLDKDSGMVTTTGTTTYTITSVGKYMETTKAIKEEVPVKRNSGEDDEDYSLVDGALAAAGGKVTLSNSQGGSLNGDLYGEKVQDKTGAEYADGHNKGSYPSGQLKTHIPESVFDLSSYPDYISIPKVDVYTLAANTNYYWDTKKDFYAWGKITGANGATIYLDNGANTSLKTTIIGPTEGEPLTIVVPYKNAKICMVLSGRIRILAAGKILLENGASQSSGMFILASNGDVEIDRDIPPYAFISSDGNLTMDNHGFTGQMQAAGNIKLGGTYTYSKAVLSDPYMKLPAGMTVSKNN